MVYDNVIQAEFIRRPNRFIAEVEINGSKEIVHVKNTGRCSELLVPGCEVWLTAPGTPDRKTKYDLIAVRKNSGILFNIDSQAPNKVVKEWLALQNFDTVIPEYTYGDSRIDFYMERNGSKYLMEVKGCTLETDGVGYFPDAPTERGVKHIRELIKAQKAGYHAILAFVIQMDGVSEVRANWDTHPEFGTALEEAEKAGVEIRFFRCHVEPDSLQVVSCDRKNMKTVRVVAAIIRDGDRIFATQRGYGDFKDGWEFPGGKIEKGETPSEAIAREIREELSADILVGELLTTVEYDYPKFHLSMDCFWAELKAGTKMKLLEHEAAKWLSIKDIDSVDWLPADIEVVKAIKQAEAD